MNCLLLEKDAPLQISADNPKLEHIRKVLKLADGGEIFVGNAGGELRVCAIKYTPEGAKFTPLRPAANPPPLNAVLCAAFSRPQIAQRVLFEAACFGAKAVVFYPAEKGEADYAKSALYAGGEHLKWLEKGAEQACATHIPDFFAAKSLSDAAEIAEKIFPDNPLKIAPDVYEASASMSDAAANARNTILAFGGERGFSAADRNALRARGFTLASLGARVLRTDSAIISALAILSQHKQAL